MAARIDEEFPDHPKVVDLTDRAFRLHITALCFCAQNLTDGHISKRTLTVLRAKTNATGKHIGELVNASLWDAASDGYVIHDYLDKNDTSGDIKRKRDEAKERMRRLRAASGSRERSDEQTGERSDERSLTACSGTLPLTFKEQDQKPFARAKETEGEKGRFVLSHHDAVKPLDFEAESKRLMALRAEMND